MTVYRWKSGARAPVPAQVAGEECERLGQRGKLTPQALVDASRPEDAPLHGAFEWNDAIAAERYREVQAGYIIRSVEVVANDATPTRAFVSLSVDGERRSYSSIEVVMSRKDTRDALLAQARAELESFKRKYEKLEELAAVFAAIEEVEAA